MARPTSTRVNGGTYCQPPPPMQCSTAPPLLRSSFGARCMLHARGMLRSGVRCCQRHPLSRDSPATARGVDEEKGKRGHKGKSTTDRPRPPTSVQRPTLPLRSRRKTTRHRHVGNLTHVLLVWDTAVRSTTSGRQSQACAAPHVAVRVSHHLCHRGATAEVHRHSRVAIWHVADADKANDTARVASQAVRDAIRTATEAARAVARPESPPVFVLCTSSRVTAAPAAPVTSLLWAP